MKRLKRYLYLLLLTCIVTSVHAQSEVALEQIQIFSNTQPKLNYWHLPENISFIQKALDTGLFKELNIVRSTIAPTIKKELTKQNQVGKISINWEATRNIPFHAYLEIYELDPTTAYQNKLVDISEDKQDSIHSIWAIACNIFNQKHDRVFQKTIFLGLLPFQNIGMGYPIGTVATTPNSLFQALSKGVSLLSPDLIDMDFLEARVPAAYATDNYWMPLVHNQSRTMFDTTKQFISFTSLKGLQLLRIPSATLNKIDLKNKSESYIYKNIVATIKNSRTRSSTKEYYQVIQSLRDVHANKDYTLQAYLEFSPDAGFQFAENNKQSLIFLPNFNHSIFEGKDSVGEFVVKEMVPEKDKYYYPDQIYNGYDSSSKFNLGSNNGPEAITHSRVIEGNIYKHSFKIQFSLPQKQKSIYVDDKISMIIEGTNKPHQMVSIPNAIDDSFKNLLLMIAYGELFQSPNN